MSTGDREADTVADDDGRESESAIAPADAEELARQIRRELLDIIRSLREPTDDPT